jgi:alpha-galactosidase
VPYILTPPALDKPKINGTRIIGARPGNPILFHIPATGKRPMTFSVSHLPVGLVLDPDLGRIYGKIEKDGLYRLAIIAENEFGIAKRELRISVGDRICLTPPMGWNSWNCWATSVDDAKVRTSAKAMKESGLINHGWTYINIDDTWEGKRGGEFNGIQPNSKFPDMKSLSDYIHGLGLKLGIYSTPWITTYAGFCGGSSDDINGKWNQEEAGNRRSWRHGKYAFDVNDAAQWAQWGIDYLKYDWNPNSVKETRRMKEALESCGRDIIFSLSNSAPFELAHEWGKLANCWRTTGDIRDTWSSMSRIGFSQDRWRKYAGPGYWNDPDMLVIGLVGWGPDLHPTRLTPDEQYTHISLWSLLSAPLLLGCDLSRLNDFTMNLLTNDEVIEINQDPLGRQAKLLFRKDGKEIWVKEMEDGSKAVGLFLVSKGNGNPADYFDWDMNKEKIEITVKWSDLGISGRHIVRDVWRQKDMGVFSEQFTTEVSYHGVVLIRIFNAGL